MNSPTENADLLYAIIGRDTENSLERRRNVRPEHIKRIEELKDQGRLVLAGPFPAIDSDDPGEAGFTGSLVVAEFATLAEAQAWANADPYVSASVFAEVVVKPFKRVLP